jgi:hypothetical protein
MSFLLSFLILILLYNRVYIIESDNKIINLRFFRKDGGKKDMGQNSQKNPYANRTNFVHLGVNACNRAFSGAMRACQKSAKFLIQKSYDYNKRFKVIIGESWRKPKPKND